MTPTIRLAQTYRSWLLTETKTVGALGDPTRRSIVLQLPGRPQAVGELAAALPVSRPAVSQHLKVLKDAGLVAEGPGSWRSSHQTGVVVSWDIRPYWQIETDHDHTSEVEIRFVAETPQRTRLELEHRNIERHGSGWDGVREVSTTTPDGPCTSSIRRRRHHERSNAGRSDRPSVPSIRTERNESRSQGCYPAPLNGNI